MSKSWVIFRISGDDHSKADTNSTSETSVSQNKDISPLETIALLSEDWHEDSNSEVSDNGHATEKSQKLEIVDFGDWESCRVLFSEDNFNRNSTEISVQI